MKHKKVLVTGASGFIGSFLCEKGLELGYEVWAGVRKSSSRQFLQNPDLNFIELNFENKEILKSQIESFIKTNSKFEYIIHNAGITKAAKEFDFLNINFINTKNFIEALTELKVLPDKFVFTSSLAAVGPGKANTINPIKDENTPIPINLYGKSKLEAENYIKSVEGLNYIIFRPTGVYGFRDKDYLNIFKLINNGIELYLGSGKKFISFIFIKDLVDAYFLALESNLSKRSYLLSEENGYEVSAFYSMIKQEINKKTIKITIPLFLLDFLANLSETTGKMLGFYPVFNKDKVEILKVTNWICDTEPLLNDLHFKTKYNLHCGIKETLRWYKENGWIK
jgi:nucleoside-diphosphate-sugar epimerase